MIANWSSIMDFLDKYLELVIALLTVLVGGSAGLIIKLKIKKGDVLGVARVAGIMAVKQTSSIIPMCHPLMISKCSIDFELDEKESSIKAICAAKVEGKTGVEMEALHGVSAALLTIYDMCKAIDKRMVIKEIHLVEKHGGKSGDFYY
jgi:cyclic pyranopterin phosphate synthase